MNDDTKDMGCMIITTSFGAGLAFTVGGLVYNKVLSSEPVAFGAGLLAFGLVALFSFIMFAVLEKLRG